MVTWQIVAGLANAVIRVSYPYPFTYFANAVEVFMLNFFTFFHTECLARTTYADKLMVALTTVLSLGAIAVAVGAFATRMWGGTILRSWSFKSYLVLIYDVLPMMSSMAFSAFSCDQVSEQHLGEANARQSRRIRQPLTC